MSAYDDEPRCEPYTSVELRAASTQPIGLSGLYYRDLMHWAADEIERLRVASLTALEALRPLAAHVHSDGVDAPYPTDYWNPRLTAAKAAYDVLQAAVSPARNAKDV